jgi:hypothetical protein
VWEVDDVEEDPPSPNNHAYVVAPETTGVKTTVNESQPVSVFAEKLTEGSGSTVTEVVAVSEQPDDETTSWATKVPDVAYTCDGAACVVPVEPSPKVHTLAPAVLLLINRTVSPRQTAGGALITATGDDEALSCSVAVSLQLPCVAIMVTV